MSGATDSGMMKMMGIVMAALAVLAVIAALAARSFSDGISDDNDPVVRQAMLERIQPVGAVRTSADDLPAASEQVVAMASGPKTGQELVDGACAACHLAGVAGAHKIGDDAAWAPKRELGLEALVASVINGKGSMPARGGSTYSDEEITRAVQHIAMFESTESEPEATVQSEESEAVTTPADASEDTSETNASDASEDSASNEASSSESAAVAVAVVGQEPEGLTDSIKTAVNGVCAGCHLAGVANAPKTGDKEAWQLRADKGMDALVASVINGLNVMPARGGSTLTDEEIPVAIQYLMSK